MIDYQIQPNTRRCSVTQRELQPGEKVYSVLTVDEGKFVRKDFSAEAWQGPPPGAFSFWAGKVAAGPEAKRKPEINDELLGDFFLQLEGHTEPAKVNIRYVLALLLMRRRRLRFEETASEAGQEVLVVRARSGEQYRVANPGLSEDELESVQNDLFQAVGCEWRAARR